MTDDREAEAVLGRVAKLAESWAALAIPGASGTVAENVAAEIDAHCGRVLLDAIHSVSSPATRLDRVTSIAEAWLTPGGPGLFYPAAGQCVLDAAKVPETGWQQRAEAAEAKLAAIADACRSIPTSRREPMGADEVLARVRRDVEGAQQPAPGRAEQDTATARTLITPALLAELGRRIGEYENAIDWHTTCTSCAAVMDSAYAETMRREAAEAKLAALAAHCRGHLELSGSCCPHLAQEILAVIGSEEGQAAPEEPS